MRFDYTIYDGNDNYYDVEIAVVSFDSGFSGIYDREWENCFPQDDGEIEFDIYFEGELRNDLQDFADYADVYKEAEKLLLDTGE